MEHHSKSVRSWISAPTSLPGPLMVASSVSTRAGNSGSSPRSDMARVAMRTRSERWWGWEWLEFMTTIYMQCWHAASARYSLLSIARCCWHNAAALVSLVARCLVLQGYLTWLARQLNFGKSILRKKKPVGNAAAQALSYSHGWRSARCSPVG